jgi:hypothetical protein
MILAISLWFALCLGASAKPKSDEQPHRGGAGGGSHGSGAEALRSRTPHPLYRSRDGTPHTCPAQPDQICQDRNSLPAESRPDIPRPETTPSFSTDRYLAEKSVIAGVTICNVKREAPAGGQSEPMQSVTPPAESGQRSRLPAPQAVPPAPRPGPASAERV